MVKIDYSKLPKSYIEHTEICANCEYWDVAFCKKHVASVNSFGNCSFWKERQSKFRWSNRGEDVP